MHGAYILLLAAFVLLGSRDALERAAVKARAALSGLCGRRARGKGTADQASKDKNAATELVLRGIHGKLVTVQLVGEEEDEAGGDHGLGGGDWEPHVRVGRAATNSGLSSQAVVVDLVECG